ncbi:hypothetical protein EV360DRAFT_55228 [Lentinula raphanica]|nr:hypothetical protein EV360DRAFT_55228 [Lentinula raphanica]
MHKLSFSLGPSPLSLLPQPPFTPSQKFESFHLSQFNPPWDIHMFYPYDMLTEDKMRPIPIPTLQPLGGLLFLWVAGCMMEVGRESL